MVYNPSGNEKIYPDPILTNISVGWLNDNVTAADVLFPNVPVSTKGGKYYVFGYEAWLPVDEGSVRAPMTKAHEIPGITRSDDSYFADEHALEIGVADEEEEEYGSEPDLNAHADAAELVTGKLAMEREIEARDIAYDEDRYHPDNVETLTSGDFFDEDTSDPIAVFKDLQRDFHRKMFTVPNVAVIPWRVFSFLEEHPDFIERIKYSALGVTTPQLVAQLLGLPRVVVPGMGYDASGNVGRPTELSYIWQNNIVLAYTPGNAAKKTPSYGYTFNKGINGQDVATDTRRDDTRIGDVVRSRMFYDIKMVAKDENGKNIAGMLIKNALSPANA